MQIAEFKEKSLVKTNKNLMHVYSCKHHSIDLDGHVVKGGLLQLYLLTFIATATAKSLQSCPAYLLVQ